MNATTLTNGGAGPVRRLLRLAWPRSGRLAVSVLAGVGAAGSAVGLTAASAWLISRAAQMPPVLTLSIAIVAVRFFGIARGVLRYGERLAGHDATLRVLGDLRAASYARLERLTPAGTAGLRAGDLVSRFATDVDAGLDVLVRVVLPYAVAALTGAASVAVLVALLPSAGVALALGLVAVAVGVPLVQGALARRTDRRLAPLRGELAGRTVDLLHGLADLTAYQATGPALAAAGRTDARLRRVAARSALATGAGTALVALATGACVWLGLALGTPAVRAGTLDGVNLAVLVLTPLAVFEIFAGLPEAAATLRTGRTALRRVFAVLDRPDPVPAPADPAPLPAGPYRLRAENVSARWTARGPVVVSGVDIDLSPGRRVALLGPSGSGKSTLAALLVRFLDPCAGRVTLNGVDLRELADDEVRTVVGLLDDGARMFDTTIGKNLRIGRPDASDGDLWAALDAVRLRGWVDGLPRGLDTPVGEHGARLSGGQRRRLALARALLADFPILILDEPTEHLDEPTARELTNDLLAATAGRTTLLITHRGYGLDRVDQVITLA